MRYCIPSSTDVFPEPLGPTSTVIGVSDSSTSRRHRKFSKRTARIMTPPSRCRTRRKHIWGWLTATYNILREAGILGHGVFRKPLARQKGGQDQGRSLLKDSELDSLVS